MFDKIRIQNFKSIYDETIELGRVNVFIGANGSGKSNLLEAIAFASAAADNQEFNNDVLFSKGVRVAMPSLMFSSFAEKKRKEHISITLFNGEKNILFDLKTTDSNPFPNWQINNKEFYETNNNSKILSIKELALIQRKKEKEIELSEKLTKIDKQLTNDFNKRKAELDYLKKRFMHNGIKKQGELKNEKSTIVDKQTIIDFSKKEFEFKQLATQVKANKEKKLAALKKINQLLDIEITLYNSIKNNSIKNMLHIEQDIKKNDFSVIEDFLIYTASTTFLRGIHTESRKEPLGINGEGLDVLLASFDKEEIKKLKYYNYLIGWLEDFFVDKDDALKLRGYKLNRSKSVLYFKDRFMMRKNNVFSAENSNEGILHILFYLALMISKRTPKFFAIDNIESSLNPILCRNIITVICDLVKENEKQVLITTHNPAILDGLNLNDDDIRLFEVYRNNSGHTKARRIKLNPETKPEKIKLSELWTRNYIGAGPNI